MSTMIRTRIVKIGNSQGIRIPRLVLEQSGIESDVELEVKEGAIIIREMSHPRQNWESAFRAMAEQGDDGLVNGDDVLSTVWDEEEWEW